MINNKSWLYADFETGVSEGISRTKNMELLLCPLQHRDHGFGMFQTYRYQALQAQRLACELLYNGDLRKMLGKSSRRTNGLRLTRNLCMSMTMLSHDHRSIYCSSHMLKPGNELTKRNFLAQNRYTYVY